MENPRGYQTGRGVPDMTDHIITNNFSSLANSMELNPFGLTDYARDFASDFDTTAASYDYYKACCEALAAVRPECHLLRDGQVLGSVDSPDLSEDEKETLNELFDAIDVTAILQAHYLTAK